MKMHFTRQEVNEFEWLCASGIAATEGASARFIDVSPEEFRDAFQRADLRPWMRCVTNDFDAPARALLAQRCDDDSVSVIRTLLPADSLDDKWLGAFPSAPR